MHEQPAQIITELIESNLPLDWVTLEQFGKLIGYPASRLYRAKEQWPEGQVWQKVGKKVYFSIKGWNEWLNQQSIREASEYEATLSKLTSQSPVVDDTLQFPNRRRRRGLAKRGSFELT